MFELPPIDCERTTSIIVNFLRKRKDEAGAKGYVVGLSGGIDSSLSATLLVKAVGSANVRAFFLPTSTTPSNDLNDVKLLCDNLGLKLQEIDIQPVLESFSREIQTPIDSHTPGWSNFKARLRMVVLYFYACLLYTSPSPRDLSTSRMPSSA